MKPVRLSFDELALISTFLSTKELLNFAVVNRDCLISARMALYYAPFNHSLTLLKVRGLLVSICKPEIGNCIRCLKSLIDLTSRIVMGDDERAFFMELQLAVLSACKFAETISLVIPPVSSGYYGTLMKILKLVGQGKRCKRLILESCTLFPLTLEDFESFINLFPIDNLVDLHYNRFNITSLNSSPARATIQCKVSNIKILDSTLDFHHLIRLLPLNPSLSSLSISTSSPPSLDQVKQLLERVGPGLEEVSIKISSSIYDEHLGPYGIHSGIDITSTLKLLGTNLKFLRLSGFKDFTLSSLHQFSLSPLESLQLDCCSFVIEKSEQVGKDWSSKVREIYLSSFPRLKVLDLGWLPFDREEGEMEGLEQCLEEEGVEFNWEASQDNEDDGDDDLVHGIPYDRR